MPDTWDADARPGDIVLGFDGNEWGVVSIARSPRLAVTLVRNGTTITGYPPVGTEARILSRATVPAGPETEVAAMRALVDAGLAPELLGESWQT